MLPERITRKIDSSGGPDACWPWTGCLVPNGYGVAWWKVGNQYVHRLVYEDAAEPIPAGHHIDHLCDNRRCQNPAHLRACTARENILRSSIAPAAVNARKTHCRHGHEFTEANTYTSPSRNRQCRECNRIRHRRYLVAGP